MVRIGIFSREVRSLLHPIFYKWIPRLSRRGLQEFCMKALAKYI